MPLRQARFQHSPLIFIIIGARRYRLTLRAEAAGLAAHCFPEGRNVHAFSHTSAPTPPFTPHHWINNV
ncbi:hypothetical protein HNQ64_001823 [Prosthecobacter dejongeii]|uniref:Uncharacterized protein n=1 Tax=Prosthecobacter dejongeii TaxID=48465 RepID=A0A7W7YK39_9BACT|nr:hypothetical protein [Prosthecobacter dejongeii]